MMILKCKKAGKEVVGENGLLMLCSSCDGKIQVQDNRVKLVTKANGFRPLPRLSTAGFNCPATINNQQSSELVEVIG